MEAYGNMKLSYDKLWDKLSADKITQKQFKDALGIGSSTIASLSKNKSVTLDTICRICDYFHCMPEDIVTFIPDEDYAAREAKKADIEAQMAELKKQLSQI